MAPNNRQGRSSGQARPMTNNEEMSLADKLTIVLKALKARREEIEAVLPTDIPFDHFHAVANQAMRNNPDVLKATAISIVNACVKAAYDGLRLDGREAALVTHNVKVARNPDRWETMAQYFPMVFGLVQQVLRGGEIVALEASIIYENDAYAIQRGTNAGIHHVPLLTGDRGKPIAAYSVATYKSGYVGFEFMTEAQILDVRAASKSGQDKEGNVIGIWKRWPDAMWKKTVIRQHRKTLPLGGRDIYDAEQNDEFEALANNTAGQIAPPKPTRASTALADQRGSEGVPLDFGKQDVDRDGELIEVKSTTGASTNVNRNTSDGNLEAASTATIEIPEDETAWAAWAKEIEARVLAAGMEAIAAIQRDERERIEAAGQDRANFIKNLITDRLADLASEDAADQARDGNT